MGDIKEHYSFLCRIQLGRKHKPCSGQCDCNACYMLWLEQEIDPVSCMCECHKDRMWLSSTYGKENR